MHNVDAVCIHETISYGAPRYEKNAEIDKSTGELKEAAKGKPYVDMEKFIEDENYEGCYCIVTNLSDEDGSGEFSDDKIIDMYRGLWRIEDNLPVILRLIQKALSSLFNSKPDYN